ncbi:MAG: PqqD family protein [Ignisphaera sp.]|nr:PqqD family protein [Ignisphaera sp.]MCX8168350.1 PqqD family protein [Ignisphaera sp.]MDW8085317.1 PqqD family protein [Ignisphaera sp.]
MSDETKEETVKTRWNEVYMKKGSEIGVDKGDFVVAVDEEKAYALAPAVYYVWSMCDGETSIGKIVENLAESMEEDIDTGTLYSAVVDIIDRLVEVNLLEKVG